MLNIVRPTATVCLTAFSFYLSFVFRGRCVMRHSFVQLATSFGYGPSIDVAASHIQFHVVQATNMRYAEKLTHSYGCANARVCTRCTLVAYLHTQTPKNFTTVPVVRCAVHCNNTCTLRFFNCCIRCTPSSPHPSSVFILLS